MKYSNFFFLALVLFVYGCDREVTTGQFELLNYYSYTKGLNFIRIDSLNYLLIDNMGEPGKIGVKYIHDVGEIVENSIVMRDNRGDPLTTFGMLELKNEENNFRGSVKWVRSGLVDTSGVQLYSYNTSNGLSSWEPVDQSVLSPKCFGRFYQSDYMGMDNINGKISVLNKVSLTSIEDSLSQLFYQTCIHCPCEGFSEINFEPYSPVDSCIKVSHISSEKHNHKMFKKYVELVLSNLCYVHVGRKDRIYGVPLKLYVDFNEGNAKRGGASTLSEEEMSMLDINLIDFYEALVYLMPGDGFYNLDKVPEAELVELNVKASDEIVELFLVNHPLRVVLLGLKTKDGFHFPKVVRSNAGQLIAFTMSEDSCGIKRFHYSAAGSLVDIRDSNFDCLTGKTLKNMKWE